MNIAAITHKENLIASRDSRLKALYFSVLIVMFAAIVVGWNRTETFEQERIAAANEDREVWHNQGERNPHSAAHFSRYAFKPIPTLSSFDPGSIDYAGLAVWMEAHTRNPATFRYAESAGDLARFVSLSPAWVMQYMVPLVIILMLFASYAGEREDGTLRQLMSYGASPALLFKGKLNAALRGLLKLLVPLIVLIIGATFFLNPGFSQEDILFRLFSLFIVYGMYLFIFAMLAIGISALSNSRRTAAIALFACWCLLTVLAPRFSGEIAVTLTPQPDGFETSQSLKNIGRAYWGQRELREEHKRALLRQYGVNETKELPINFAAFELQRAEEYADPHYDTIYETLTANHKQQEETLSLLSVLSPTTALQALSAGFSGTDRMHHEFFAQQAETHRRGIIKQMNEDMMLNAGEAGYTYQSDEHLWRQIPGFDGSLPTLSQFLIGYGKPFIILSLWAMAAFAFGTFAARRAANLEAVK